MIVGALIVTVPSMVHDSTSNLTDKVCPAVLLTASSSKVLVTAKSVLDTVPSVVAELRTNYRVAGVYDVTQGYVTVSVTRSGLNVKVSA